MHGKAIAQISYMEIAAPEYFPLTKTLSNRFILLAAEGNKTFILFSAICD
jgi:hypothetical protein